MTPVVGRSGYDTDPPQRTRVAPGHRAPRDEGARLRAGLPARRRLPRRRPSPRETSARRARRGPALPRLGLDRQRRLARPRPALGGRGGPTGGSRLSWRWRTSTRRSRGAAPSTRRAAPTPRRYTRGPGLPHAARAPVHRSHVAQSRREDRLAVVVGSPAPDGTVDGVASPAPSCATGPAGLRRRGGLARRQGGAARGRRASPGMARQVRLQDDVAGAMKAAREERGALDLRRSSRRLVFDGDAVADLRPTRRTARRT